MYRTVGSIDCDIVGHFGALQWFNALGIVPPTLRPCFGYLVHFCKSVEIFKIIF